MIRGGLQELNRFGEGGLAGKDVYVSQRAYMQHTSTDAWLCLRNQQSIVESYPSE